MIVVYHYGKIDGKYYYTFFKIRAKQITIQKKLLSVVTYMYIIILCSVSVHMYMYISMCCMDDKTGLIIFFQLIRCLYISICIVAFTTVHLTSTGYQILINILSQMPKTWYTINFEKTRGWMYCIYIYIHKSWCRSYFVSTST